MANETLIPNGLIFTTGTWTDQAGGPALVTLIDEGVGAASGTDYLVCTSGSSEIATELPSRALTGPFLLLSVKIVAKRTGPGTKTSDVTPVIDGVSLSSQTITLTTDWQLFTLNWSGTWTAAEIDSTGTNINFEQSGTGSSEFHVDAVDVVIYEEVPPASLYQGGSLRVVVGNMCPRQGSYVWPVFPY